MYVTPTGVDDFVVEKSDGNDVAGFLIFSSENYAPGQSWGSVNNYTAGQVRQSPAAASGASTVTMMNGGGRYLTFVYETVALGGGGVRNGGPAVYTLNEPLKVSENGLLCNDSDLFLAAAGVVNPHVVALCSAVPAARNNLRLGFDSKW